MSEPVFAQTLDGKIAEMLHAALRTIGKLEEELQLREAVIAELKQAVRVRQAMLDALVPKS